MRGDNLNPIVDGVRADPAFGNIIATVTDTEIRRHEFYVNVMWYLAAPGPGLSRDLVNWKRVNIAAGWSRIYARNNSNGPFSPPPTGNLADDYGYGPADMPYRVNVQFNSNQVRPLAINLTWNASDGFPYNWTTGSDDNHDGLVDDRPAGVGLRTLRTTPQSTLNARATYTFARAGAGAVAGDAPASLPARPVCGGEQHHQPPELRGLQRRAGLAQLRKADDDSEPAEDRLRNQHQF